MKLPTSEELKSAAAAFDRDWGAVDEVLYGICREHPGHVSRREVTAKVVLIDRAYSAGLERQVVPDVGEQAVSKIATFLLVHGVVVDALIDELSALQEPLDATSMAAIVSAHGRFTDLLRHIPTRDTAPRSFAAKYLHFHCPVVPIYDSYAAAGLIRRVRWDSHEIPFTEPPAGDYEFWEFCVRFYRLHEACRDAGVDVSVKRLDTYLWAVPGAK